MVGSTAENIDFAPVWGDLDDMFIDETENAVPLGEIFDDMVARQADNGGDLKDPCEEAQELLDRWQSDNDYDYLPDWRAAVARRQPGVAAVEEDGDRQNDAAIRGRETDGLADFMNDAEVLGTGDDDLVEFLGGEATFLLGEMWGARDRRNTQDGDWNQLTLPWMNWLLGHPGDKNAPAWGFTRHPVGKDKAGASIVLGSSVGGARKAKAMDTMFAMGLDIDSGAKLDEVLDTLEGLGLLCFVYTSYNHGKSGVELKRDEVLRKLQIKRDPTVQEVRQFLREHDKNRYEESFIAACTIKEQKSQTSEGVKIVLDTPPLEKFRLIFPLAAPVKIIDLAETHQEALDLWEDKITGLARNLLGVHFDTSCTDPSRLFYTARHPKGNDDWYAAVLQGKPLAFEDVEPMKKSSYTSKREVNAFTMAGGEDEDDRPPMAVAPSGASLNDWHRSAKDRFQMADLLETLCPDKIRVAGNEAAGQVHIECPFEAEHSSEGGTACDSRNSTDSTSGYWTWSCHHDSCQGRHKLEFLEEALRQGWFEEAALFDTEQGFLLEVADGEDDPFEPVEAKKERARTFEEEAEEIDDTAPWSEIEAFCKRIYKEGADKTAQVNIAAIIAKNTNHTRPDVKAVFKELDGATRKVQAGQELTDPVVNEWDFTQMHEHSAERIHAANRESPSIFHNAHDLCAVRAGSDGRHAIRALDKDGFAHHLNSTVRFVKTVGEDKTPIGVAAPQEVVNYLYAADRSAYPPLRGLVTTPAFTAAGGLLTQPGYDWDSQLFFHPDPSLTMPDVSDVPTEDEIFEAKRLLVQEVLADFMLDGMDRAETIRKALCCEEVDGELQPIPDAEPEATPSLCHAIVMAVFPFVRDMIGRNAAGIAIDKQKPGAGAGKLEASMSAIYAGRGTAAMALPTNPEEMTKVLLPALRSGDPNVFFDNINAAVDSGELASAMTAPTYRARVLNKSETVEVEVEVRCQWVVAGNKLRLSDELTRRFALIYLDPKTATPEARTGFRNSEIEEWVRENRGRLIWACLTLAQNWIAGGRQPGTKDKASYSQWARVMGGILDAAGIKGFLANEKDMKARSSVSDDPVRQLVERLADYDDGQLFVTGSVAKRHPDGTASVKAILEGFHEDEESDAQCLRLPGWGYDSFGIYSSPQKLGSGFKRDVAAEPHKVGDVEVSFEPVENASGVKLWRMVKRDPAKAE